MHFSMAFIHSPWFSSILHGVHRYFPGFHWFFHGALPGFDAVHQFSHGVPPIFDALFLCLCIRISMYMSACYIYVKIFRSKSSTAEESKRPVALSTMARLVAVIRILAENPHWWLRSTFTRHFRNNASCWNKQRLTLGGLESSKGGCRFDACACFSSAPVPHSNFPPLAHSSQWVKSRYLPTSTDSFRGKAGSRMGLPSWPQRRRTSCKERSLSWILPLFPTPQKWSIGQNKSLCSCTSFWNAAQMKEHAWDLPALGPPTRQAHHRALFLKCWLSSVYNPTASSLFWQEAKQDWNRSKAKMAGKPQPRCKYPHATAKRKLVVCGRTDSRLAASSTRTLCVRIPFKLSKECIRICWKLWSEMYWLYSGMLSQYSWCNAQSPRVLANVAK